MSEDTWEAGSRGCAHPSGRATHAAGVFRQLTGQGADFLLTVKTNQKTLYRQIANQVLGKRKIPFIATDHEFGHGRDICWGLRAKEAPEHIKANWHGTSWITEVIATGMSDGKSFHASHFFLTSLRTTPEALQQLVRERWSLESWHWIRDTQVHEDKHRFRGNGACVMATMRTAALNLLQIAGFNSIRAGLQAVMHVIQGPLAMVRRRPALTRIKSLLKNPFLSAEMRQPPS